MGVPGAYLDDGFFLFWTNAASASSSNDVLKAAIARALTDRIPIFVPATVYECPTGVEGRQLYHVLFEEPQMVGLSPFDVRDLAALIDRCRQYESGDGPASRPGNWPRQSGAYRAIADIPSEQGVPILLASANYGPFCAAELEAEPVREFLVAVRADDFMLAFRHAIVHATDFDMSFGACKERAFPALLFAPSLQPSDLGVDLSQFGRKVIDHLSYLNDSYLEDAEGVNWDQFRLQRIAAAKGIDLSDESANTKAAREKMKLREVSVQTGGLSRTLTCSLHTKLEPIRGRIHFCSLRKDQRVQIVVGIFNSHLPT